MKSQVVWMPIASAEKPPIPRWGHTMSVSGSKLFIFGGTGNKVFGDCYVFDLGTKECPSF